MKLPSKEQCLEWAKKEKATQHIYESSPGLDQWQLEEDDLQALIHRAYREGAEAMREKAAKKCYDMAYASTEPMKYMECELAIRNLKV